jgi:thiamine biosynthesis protein ThiI
MSESESASKENSVFILRYAEVGIKGKRARGMMEGKIRTNFRELLSRLGDSCEIRSSRGRIFVSGFKSEDNVRSALSRTMGIKSFSHATEIRIKSIEDILDYCKSRFPSQLKGKKFAVRARRAGGQSFTSMDIARAVGDSLYSFSAGVDLGNPDLEINVEVRDNRAYIFTDSQNGPGGLPIGSEGRVAALVSGGIDSPVAAWYLLKRGCMVDYVFISLAHPADTVEFLKSIRSLIKFWSSGYIPSINIVDGTPLLEEILLSGKVRVPNITYKRALYEIAKRIALEKNGNGIVTGESIGQVSSQTPANLMAINAGFDFPVFRPLVGLDKDEITEVARRIGTFPETSMGEFCSLFSQEVVLRADPEIIKSDFSSVLGLEEMVRTRVQISASEIDDVIESLQKSNLLSSEIPEGAYAFDLRAPLDFREWHYPGAVNIGLKQLKDTLIQEGKWDRPVVFYCTKGLQSAYAAGIARKMGIDSYFVPIDSLRRNQAKKVTQ